MRFRYGVSRAAIILAATGLGSAQAQTATITPCDANVRNLLEPFLSLNASGIGRATLPDNLAQAIAVNDRSTPDQRALVISGQVRPGAAPYLGALTLVDGSVVKLGPADNLAGGLPLQAIQSNPGRPRTINPMPPAGGYGPVPGPLYQQGIRASTDTTGPLARTFDLLKRACTFTSADLSVATNDFANGAATHPRVTPAGYVAIPAVAPAGYTLPRFNGLPNTTTSVLDIAAGVTNPQAGQDVCGRSRPVAAGHTATWCPRRSRASARARASSWPARRSAGPIGSEPVRRATDPGRRLPGGVSPLRAAPSGRRRVFRSRDLSGPAG